MARIDPPQFHGFAQITIDCSLPQDNASNDFVSIIYQRKMKRRGCQNSRLEPVCGADYARK